jgi:hypothetical protein
VLGAEEDSRASGGGGATAALLLGHHGETTRAREKGMGAREKGEQERREGARLSQNEESEARRHTCEGAEAPRVERLRNRSPNTAAPWIQKPNELQFYLKCTAETLF